MFFGKVPEDEIVTCFYYEYARSREDIRQLVSSWREKLADLDKAFDTVNSVEARMQRGGCGMKHALTKKRQRRGFGAS
jgi:hypothetical protein